MNVNTTGPLNIVSPIMLESSAVAEKKKGQGARCGRRCGWGAIKIATSSETDEPCPSVESVTLQDSSVEDTKGYAFDDCRLLGNISIPSTVKTLGKIIDYYYEDS